MGPRSLLFNVTILSIGALGTCCGTVPTSRWAFLPPPLLPSLLHIWPKWGKMASGAAVHTQPFMKSPTGALELKWEVSREKWKCNDIFMFFYCFKGPLCNLDKRASMFASLSSQGSIFLCWCLLLNRLRWADSERRRGDLQPRGWFSFTWSLKSSHIDSKSLCSHKLLNEIKWNSSVREPRWKETAKTQLI